MDDLLNLLGALGDAAGWAVAVVVLAVNLYAIAKGWLVPGFVYHREVVRGDRAEDAIDASTRTTDAAALAAKSATEAAQLAVSQLSSLQSRGRRVGRSRQDD